MARLRLAGWRRQDLAWTLTVPIAVLVVVLLIPQANAIEAAQLPWAVLYLALFVVAQTTVLHFEVQRHGFTLSVTEIPLVLALFHLPHPVLLVIVRVLSLVAVQMWQRLGAVKAAFNAAAVGLSTTVAALIAVGGVGDVDQPRTWFLLTVAVATAIVISFACTAGVVTLVQGPPPAKALIRMAVSMLVVAAVNVTVGLIVLVVIDAQAWSIVLLVGLGAMLFVVYRSYAQFVGQHRTLAEIYELTRAMGGASREGALPDILLARVRVLLQAEYATLWLPAQGRYPELQLSAHINSAGLLDVSNTPQALRDRALADGATVAVGPKTGDPQLREVLRSIGGVKDAIVVPLRSGSAVIGMLEVTGRLGELLQFRLADVRLLETIAAQVAVAVENSRLIDRLRFDAYHDALTGLPNRRRVLALLEEAVKVRAPGEVVAVMVFDIDGLRDVNDSLGHDAGDLMVREVATRLRQHAPAAALVGRASSDELAVKMRLADADAAVGLAADLRAALQEPMQVEAITLDVDVAVGVAVHPDHGTDAETLLKNAGLAAQAAKQLATPVHLYHPNLQDRSTHRSGLAADLRRAFDGGEIEVHFQPKVSLVDRRVVGVECLARWEHTAHGQVPPSEFVAVAEHTGQLGRLTEVVLREGLRRARGWRDAGRELPIAVNLSTRSLIDPTFPKRVGELLDEYGVPASLLTLEITEDGRVGQPDRPTAALRRLHELGLRLAVDDFGKGNSSLSYLRRIPVDEVKIDRSFVQGMATDPGDLAIVRAVVDLARHFGLIVVAEGVESEITVTLLEELGCDVGQGFLFSRAQPYERFEAWLAVQTEPVIPSPAVGDDGVIAEVRRLRAVQ
jgi:diguanylate cyclase (GGDEF)-like protein